MMKTHARGFGRVLVFSPLEETDRYGDLLGVVPSRTLPDFILQCSAGGHAVYAPDNPTPELFDMWCKIVWHERDVLALVDELADVSGPGKAKGWWGVLIRKGGHYGINIAAGAQRPTEVDSSIRGNATRILCFRLSKRSDRKLMADELDVELDLVTALRPLHFLDHNKLTGAVTPHRIVFS